MQIILFCTVLFIVLNTLCAVNEDGKININPSEVTAVSGLCALISCNFTNPENKLNNVEWNWNVCKKNECKTHSQQTEMEEIKWFVLDLNKNNCSIIIKEIKEDEKEYTFKITGKDQTIIQDKVKVNISIRDEPALVIPLLIEGQKTNLTCSAPFPCPETPPNITWWIRTRGRNITDLKDNITLTTSKSSYLSTLTLSPTSDLHNATVGCDVNYGSKNISTNKTLKIMYDTNGSKVNDCNSPSAKGIEDFFKNVTTITFGAGMVCSALIFSVVLCCCVSCHRCKKHKVPTANPDPDVSLKMVQTDVAQTGPNEETPLHGQPNGGNPSTAGPTDGAEEEGAVRMDAKEVDYASIDYSLLKDRAPEEEEKEPTDTDYAEIKRDKSRNEKEREVLQDEDDQTETQDQIEGEEQP